MSTTLLRLTLASLLLIALEICQPVSGFSSGLNGNVFGVERVTNSNPSRRRRDTLVQVSMKASTPPPPYPVQIAVMGGGNFGIALATVCARNGLPTTLLVRSQDVADEINTKHRHPRYMSDLMLPDNVRATTNPATALGEATYIIHAVPCQYSREFLEDIAEHVPYGTPILSASKGIETSSLGFMNDIFRETLGEDRPYAFLSGPSFAREICEGVATAVVIASEDLMLASDLAQLLSDDNFRVFTTKDVVGVEVGGAVKNVIALAAGMCEGLGLGTNAMSGLVTRGCGEMRRLGLTFGAMPSTIAGLSGKSAIPCGSATVMKFNLTLCLQESATPLEPVLVLYRATAVLAFDWEKEKRWRRFLHPLPKWPKVSTHRLRSSTSSRPSARAIVWISSILSYSEWQPSFKASKLRRKDWRV